METVFVYIAHPVFPLSPKNWDVTRIKETGD